MSEDAATILDDIAQGELNAKVANSSVLQLVIETERELGWINKAIQHTVAYLEINREPRDRNTIFGKLYSSKYHPASFLWDLLSKKNPQTPAADKLTSIYQMLFQSGKHRQQLIILTDDVERTIKALPGEDRDKWWKIMGQTYLNAGVAPVAKRFWRHWSATSQSAEPYMLLGNIYFDDKDWVPAANCYEKAWELDSTQLTALYLQGKALSKFQDGEGARRWMDLASLILLGDSYQRYKLASALQDRGLSEDAARQRELVLKTGRFRSWEYGSTLMRRGNERNDQQEFFAAANDYEMYLLGVLRTSSAFTKTKAYLILPHAVHRAKARGYFAEKNFEATVKHAKLAVETLPGDLDFPLAIVPMLDREERTQDAEAVFQIPYQAYRSVCQTYPKSASHHNNFAWLCARCNRHLEEALQHSQTANELSPKNDAYLDTLAETYFRLGQTDQAIQTIRQAIALAPESTYYPKQLKRFQSSLEK